jgi:hypothetical protein
VAGKTWAAQQTVAVVVLLALFALQVLLASRDTSPAYDETAILPAGYVFLKTGQWRVIPEHPPLIPAPCALPLLFLNPRLDLGDPLLAQDRPNPWNVGLNFLALNNDDDRLFFWGRLPVLLLALLLGYVVYRWAGELYGPAAGFTALVLYAFCPDLVAHAGFTSHDVGAACFSTLALYALWRFISRGTWQHLASAPWPRCWPRPRACRARGWRSSACARVNSRRRNRT